MKYKNFVSRKCLIVLLVSIAISCLVFDASSQAYNKGDANNNGVVDINDALAIARYSAGLGSLANMNASDVNCDNLINIMDALTVARYVAQVLPSLTCTPTITCTGCVTPTVTPTPTITRTPIPGPTCSPCPIAFDGYVVDSITLLPISGVYMRLDIMNGTGQPPVTTFTNETGYYKVVATICRDSQLNLSGVKNGYSVYSLNVVSSCGTLRTTNISLPPDTRTPSPTPTPVCTPCSFSVETTVLDAATSLPLSDVTVQLDFIDLGRSYFVTTDSTGFFSFSASTTTCDAYEAVRIIVSKPGYRTQLVSISAIKCGTVLSLPMITLTPGIYTPTPIPTTPWPCAIVLSGKVTNSLTGEPIAGAQVSSASAVRTDANGNYSLVLPPLPAGSITKSADSLLNVKAAGYAESNIPATQFDCGGYAVDFSLNPLNSK